MNNPITSERVFSIFKELNAIPRSSHYEERITDYLCQFAEQLHLEYERDAENCVVIRKAATPGHEGAEPIVLLNHLDMVCVGMNDPINNSIRTYTEEGWMKAEGTSSGADNSIGLSMALAVLENDRIVQGPIEVMTTANKEDSMPGVSQLSTDFIKGRKVINLGSKNYDTIVTGAAGAILQEHRIPIQRQPAPGGKRRWYRITFAGGLGGHSGVDINKGRASAVVLTWAILAAIYNEYDIDVASIKVGETNASIASSAEIIVCVPSGEAAEYVKAQQEMINEWIKEEYGKNDPEMHCTITKCEPQTTVIDKNAFERLLTCLEQIPQGVVKMSETMEGTVETSNNVGRILTEEDTLLVTTHTRSFINGDMKALADEIKGTFTACGGTSDTVMEAPAWQENQQSDFLRLTSDVFNDILGWRPRPVAMHFVLEAGFFVQKFPGIEIACIGPRIVEPHSTSERVELKTVDDIWLVLQELLRRLAT